MTSERLTRLLNDALIKYGMEELTKLTRLSEGAIRNIASGSRIPRRHNAYKLALACGCSEEDALALARECPSPRAKETA